MRIGEEHTDYLEDDVDHDVEARGADEGDGEDGLVAPPDWVLQQDGEALLGLLCSGRRRCRRKHALSKSALCVPQNIRSGPGAGKVLCQGGLKVEAPGHLGTLMGSG